MQSKSEMSNGRWCTKSDVLHDLAKATGRKITNIDNNFFVVGENPPPPPLFNDDVGEMWLHSNVLGANDTNVIKPDLKGIAQMLRLVREHSGSTENVDNVNICTSNPKSVCDIISISKLNPNVKEFIPKRAISYSVDLSKDKVIDHSQARSNCIGSDQGQVSDCKTSEEKFKKIPIDNNVCSEQKIINVLGINENRGSKEAYINKNRDLESINLKSNDTQAIATDLKNKITRISASQRNTFQAKKERNVALANLQKLYSSVQQNQNISFEAVNPVKGVIKLITPDFFEKCKTEDIDLSENIQQKEITNNSAVQHSYEKPVFAKSQDLTKIKETTDRSVKIIAEANCSGLEILSTEIVTNGEIKEENTSPDAEVKNAKYNSTNYDSCTIKPNVSDPQIQNSIKKVKNWFSKDDKKTKKPAVYLAPVSFKRKDLTNRQSPNEIDKKISKPTLTVTQQYVPTKYANELSKMYMERVKNKEIHEEYVSWKNLNSKLKEKDAEIEAKSKDSSSASSTAEL